MEQPALGHKIAQIRKQKNITQEELVERCHVSVRTIQRLEAGEVTPRISTIKIILAALDTDLEELKEDKKADHRSLLEKSFLIGFNASNTKEVKDILQVAWIAGIIYFILGLVEAGLDYLNFQGELENSLNLFFTVVKVSVWVSYFLFMRGFIVLGGLFDNYLLKISSYMMVGASLVIYAIEIFDVFKPLQEELYLSLMAGGSVTIGGIGIVLGIALLRLQDSMGRIAGIAGKFEIVVGVFFLSIFLFFFSLILLVPATIIEIVLLFKAYEFVSKEKKAPTEKLQLR